MRHADRACPIGVMRSVGAEHETISAAFTLLLPGGALGWNENGGRYFRLPPRTLHAYGSMPMSCNNAKAPVTTRMVTKQFLDRGDMLGLLEPHPAFQQVEIQLLALGF